MDWWPTIVTAVLLFGTGLGGLLKSIVGITFKFIPKLLGLLPGLLKFLKSPMGRIAGLAVAGAGLAGRMMDGGKDDVDLTKQDPAPQKMMDGGLVPGEGPNKDTVPAMLAPGEFVMSRGAVQKYGSDMLGSMNAAAGGTNRPEVKGGVTYAAGGGMMGDDGKEKASPKLAREMEKRDKAVQAPGGIDARHAELMKTTNPQKIADYDAKHGQGAYSKKLREKLGKIYSTPSPSGTVAPKTMPKPTGKVVGRENLPPATRAILERMDAQRAGNLPPDIKTSGPLLGRMAMSGFPGLSGGGGGLIPVMEQAKSKSLATYIGDGIQQLFGITPRRLRDDPQSILEDVKSKAKNMVTSMGGTVVDSNSQEQNMKRVMALPPEMRKAVLADMKRSGGEVKESSGQNFAGGTADRQLIKAQPGEYMLPVDTVNKLGGPSRLDQLVANTDSNSTPAKLGMRSRKTPQVGPPMPMQPQINLIPTPTGSSKGYGDSSGSVTYTHLTLPTKRIV